jgi:hypothetical protein
MDLTWKAIIWDQFDAALDTLEDALNACPDELWQARLYDEPFLPGIAEYWYIGYHTLFWLDYYLSDTFEGFAPPAPYTMSEFDPAGKLPDRVYSNAELQAYLEHSRSKLQARLERLTDEQLRSIVPERPKMTVAGLMFYNMRHVMDHAAQLSLFLGQRVGKGPGWVSHARE